MTDTPPSRFSRRTGLGMAATLLSVAHVGRVNAQESIPHASPEASPVAIPDLPQGALGEQIQWLVRLLNGDVSAITGPALEPHLDPVVLQEMPADGLAVILVDVATQASPVVVEPESMITTRDSPPTAAQFLLVGRDNRRLRASVAINRDSGLIKGLDISPEPDTSTPTG